MNEFRAPCPNCGNETGGWLQPGFDVFRCANCGDITLCPDGQEHEWSFTGHASFPEDETLLKVGECRRCGVGYVSEL